MIFISPSFKTYDVARYRDPPKASRSQSSPKECTVSTRQQAPREQLIGYLNPWTTKPQFPLRGYTRDSMIRRVTPA
jgi:hypothetical protein